MNRFLVMSGSAVLILSLSATTLAAEPRIVEGRIVRQQVVRIDDLNPQTEAGVAALYRRLRRAARDVCGEPYDAGSRVRSDDWRRCVDTALGDGVARVDLQALTAYHQQQTSRGRRAGGLPSIARGR